MSDVKVYVQPKRQSLHLIHEVEKLSQDEIVLSGGSFASGEVLGKDADGKFIKLNLTAGEAGDKAVGVLYGAVDATETDKTGLAHTRLTAVRADKLVWPEGITDARKAEFIEELKALHIIAR